ncbi:hypothetical protein ACWF94_04550 [Streptomyces sp. NPDC055078]
MLRRVLSLPPGRRIQQLGGGLERVTDALRQPALRSSPAARDLTELAREFRVLDGGSALPSPE